MQQSLRALWQSRKRFWVWRCLLMPHLKAGNREAPGVVYRSDNRNQVGAVRDVLLVKLHRNLIITWKQGKCNVNEGAAGLLGSTERTVCAFYTGLLSNVRDAAGTVFPVVKRDLRPAGPLHRHGQTTSARLPRPDAELSWSQKHKRFSLVSSVLNCAPAKGLNLKQTLDVRFSFLKRDFSLKELFWFRCTWFSCQSSLQSWTSCSHFVRTSLPQWSHGELEGAARHVHAPVPHAHAVHAHLRRHKPHVVCVVAGGDQLSRPPGAGR